MKLGVLAVLTAAVALLPATRGTAASERGYVFDGGTAHEQAEVVRVLDASAFDWRVVDAQIVIHIGRGVPSSATAGQIWLDSNLLASGKFAWGVVQQEYAHQVDFFLLHDSDRARIQRTLGGSAWCSAGLRHANLACERFASALAWAYWPSRDNCMRPLRRGGEHHFRVLLSALLRSRA